MSPKPAQSASGAAIAAPARPSVWAGVWPYALLTLIAVAFCGPALFTGKSLAPLDMLLLMSPWKHFAAGFPDFVRPHAPMLDPVQQYFPWRLFAVSSLKDGILPLWDPFAFSGTPFIANLQSAIFYPPNLLFLIMPVAFAFTCTAALHLALAGCFMFFFLRVWGVGRWPGVVAATAYMLNGYFVAWLEYPAIGLWVAVWLPLILGLHELSVRRRSAALTGLAGGAVAMIFLGGHLQVAAYVMLAYGLYVVARMIWPAAAEGPSPRRWAFPARGAVSLAIGLLLAAGQLLPTLELAARSFRPAVSAATVTNTALPLTHLIIYLVPKFFGSPPDYNYWGSLGRPAINFQETAGYVGILALVAAVFGALEWRRPVAKYLLALAAVSLLLALGTPLYLLLYYAAPGFKQLAGLARTMYLTAFAVTALAGLGLDRLQRDLSARVMVPLAGCSLLAVAAVAATFGVFSPQVSALGRAAGSPFASLPHYLSVQLLIFVGLLAAGVIIIAARRRLRATGFGVACLALAVGDGFVMWFAFNPATSPRLAYFPTPPTTYVQGHSDDARILSVGGSFLDWMPPNTPTAYQLRDIQGSDSLWWGQYFRFLRNARSETPPFVWSDLGSPVLDMLAVRHIISTTELHDPKWALAYSQGAFIYRNRAPVARARIVSAWRVGDEREALAAIRAGDRSLLDVPVLDADPGIAARPGAPLGRAEITRDNADTVAIRCRLPGPRVLVLADPNYPGWRAQVDGKATRHVTANYIFRAVTVPAGDHVVTWRYEPAGFRLGLFGGLLGTALLAGIMAAGLMHARPPKANRA